MSEPVDLYEVRRKLEEAGMPWEMDENTSMAQLTEEQRVRRLGFTPPPGELSIAEAVHMDQTAPRITREMIMAQSGITAPASFDHRNVGGRNFTTPVKDQGNCGSCVAFGTLAVMETTYRRQIDDANFAIDLSEAHMFYCLGGEEGRNCSNGWWPEFAFDKARDRGVTFESHYPYTGSQQACAVPAGWENNSARSSGRTRCDTPAAIKEWIATRGSTTGCFIVYQDFFSYRSGVYRHVTGNAAGGHCVEIIGYDDSQGCWICKNSWGTNWGESGFFRIAYGECQIETWSGPWGANSVSLRNWRNQVLINGLWNNESDRNAWVHVAGLGWRKLAPDTAPMQTAMLLELAAAKGAKRPVNILEDQQTVREVYVL